ncbi:MAG: tryptophan--tRNA ligase [Gammaproteobacteria bacterium]|nr:tryptophan--tRNA ligase [Gammaproteobacteria bacterium]
MSTVLPGQPMRVLSGMRPTGRLHLGHYHGVLKNWLKLQTEYECYFFVADWHALTTHYEDTRVIEESVWDMVVDWLAVGIDPNSATLFIQSRVPQHAELHVLLSMITPVSWLERVPTYKDQQIQLQERDLSTYGFLGYPLLQSADILSYRAGLVPVGEDQVAHVELTREVARRFNHLYGREPDYEIRAEEAIKKMGKKNAKLYRELRTAYMERGDREALETARALLERQKNIALGDKDRLFGFLEGGGKIILPEPQALLTQASKMPGLDGRKMSKSYDNVISLRESTDEVAKKLRTMPTDPARVHRSDPGNPDKCPVWDFHVVYSDAERKDWVQKGCRSAGIGCLECKQPIIDTVLAELKPIQERAAEFLRDPLTIKNVIADGTKRAQEAAEATLTDVRAAMGLGYS